MGEIYLSCIILAFSGGYLYNLKLIGLFWPTKKEKKNSKVKQKEFIISHKKAKYRIVPGLIGSFDQ